MALIMPEKTCYKGRAINNQTIPTFLQEPGGRSLKNLDGTGDSYENLNSRPLPLSIPIKGRSLCTLHSIEFQRSETLAF